MRAKVRRVYPVHRNTPMAKAGALVLGLSLTALLVSLYYARERNAAAAQSAAAQARAESFSLEPAK